MEDEKGTPTPIVTYLLLTVIVMTQIYISLLRPVDAKELYDAFSLTPVNLFSLVQVDSLLTYMFLHGNLVHLFVNSVALYGAGVLVEREIGRLKYLAVFLVSGIIAGFIHCILNFGSEIPLVGSSGAIFGVIAILFLLMPFKLTFTLVVPLPSVVVGLMLVLVELSALWMANDIGIAHDVHLSGFVTGGLSAFVLDRKRALKGFFIATVILAIIYYIGAYFNLIPAEG
ncbi:MAG: rhomboid family intramembrane serine protease [Candidatus Bathyarchaeota archaeon]|nr:MAG: rhomboid family intramembrane serine protease [Candidatus Bathyarchaeota archaeon]